MNVIRLHFVTKKTGAPINGKIIGSTLGVGHLGLSLVDDPNIDPYRSVAGNYVSTGAFGRTSIDDSLSISGDAELQMNGFSDQGQVTAHIRPFNRQKDQDFLFLNEGFASFSNVDIGNRHAVDLFYNMVDNAQYFEQASSSEELDYVLGFGPNSNKVIAVVLAAEGISVADELDKLNAENGTNWRAPGHEDALAAMIQRNNSYHRWCRNSIE